MDAHTRSSLLGLLSEPKINKSLDSVYGRCKAKRIRTFLNGSFKSYIKGIMKKNFVNLRRHARGTVNSLEVMKKSDFV